MSRKLLAVMGAILMAFSLAPAAVAHPDSAAPDDGGDHEHSADELHGPAENVVMNALAEHDLASAGVISAGPSGQHIKNLAVVGRGIRNDTQATTDVWVHDGYAYTGTFNSPCGGDPEAGIWVWDVHNVNRPEFVTIIESPVGSRTNDVRVDTMNSGDILVHSNEPCDGGPGGFEVYDVNDPANPVLLASVQTDDVNAFLRDNLGFVDFGVHNLFLFSQGSNDYVAATVESEFGNFQIFDITDPANPTLVGWWGAEQLRLAELGLDVNAADLGAGEFDVILDLDAYLFDGFGASANRFLHDITISADGQTAYLANWDAGLVTLDISDPSDPSLIAVAIDPVNGSLDGEVNSHSVWPNEDGTIVVEGEEDFSAWEGNIPPGNLTLQDLNTIPGVAIATSAGDDFEANQTGNAGTVTATEVAVTSGPLAGNTYPAIEFGGNNAPLGDGSVSGDFVWVGRACDGDPFENPLSAGDIAVVRRGACFFSDKEANVAAAGASAMVLANNQESSPWSGLRIWDYSDPTAPVLASLFDTTCSAATAPSEECVADGTYSAHNVIVETRGNKTLAYISWYSDGVVVLDVSDPYNPVEIARFLGTNEEGEMNDFWGIHKEENSPFIYASDRNGGLYVLKLKGRGLN